MEETLPRAEAHLGPTHLTTWLLVDDWHAPTTGWGGRDEALPLCERAVEIAKTTLGPDTWVRTPRMNNLAGAYLQRRAVGRGSAAIEQTLERGKGDLGPDHSTTLTTMGNLAVAYRDGAIGGEA